MTKGEYTRRNFLSSVALLSAGTAFSSAMPYLAFTQKEEGLQQKWKAFWQKTGGRVVYAEVGLRDMDVKFNNKGHEYKNGEVIYFAGENILALPTWAFWQNNLSTPADVVVTLFENNTEAIKIARLNRYELSALYSIAEEHGNDLLLAAFCNNLQQGAGNYIPLIKNKTIVKKNSQVQQVSYYKEQQLVFTKKIIHQI